IRVIAEPNWNFAFRRFFIYAAESHGSNVLQFLNSPVGRQVSDERNGGIAGFSVSREAAASVREAVVGEDRGCWAHPTTSRSIRTMSFSSPAISASMSSSGSGGTYL